jgi:type I restriction enzyme, S subunit
LGSGSTVKGISIIDIKNISFLKPSLEEQRAIAIVLSDMDNAIASLESRLAKTQAIKQGMMQELLTGRIRLKIEK